MAKLWLRMGGNRLLVLPGFSRVGARRYSRVQRAAAG
jgi:hypothetical protein